MPADRPVRLADLRRFVVARQALSPRFRRADAEDVEAAVARLGCVQLDSIAAVDRSHRITISARVGWYPEPVVSRLLREGRLFEYWAHEACLVPAADYPLYRWRMKRYRRNHPWRGDVDAKHPGLCKRVLAEIAARGPLASRDFEGEGDGRDTMWNWKPAKIALETLFSGGELAIAGRNGFQRLYDLPERVLPRALLDAKPLPEKEAHRTLVLRAVEARGALTETGIKEHCRFKGGVAFVRPLVDALVREDRVRRVAVEDGGPDVVVPAGVPLDGAPAGALLLSPFENLLWDRPFAERLFDFRHIIEVYKREHERKYGYYVLPLLVDDRLLGRADLRADRKESVLRVHAFHVEPGVRRALDATLDKALLRLARALDLERVERR